MAGKGYPWGHLGLRSPAVIAAVRGGQGVQGADEHGRTPLMAASGAGGSAHDVAILLGEGADPSAQDAEDTTALHVACANGNVEAIHMLLEAGQGQFTDDVNADGHTPLYLASARGHADAVTAMLGGGADPDILACEGEGWGDMFDDGDPMTGEHTAVFAALMGGHDEVVDVLLTHGVNDEAGYLAPLLAAAVAGNIGVAARLIAEGANPGCIPETYTMGWGVLELAAMFGRTRFVEWWLRDMGGHPDGTRMQELPPLQMAIQHDNLHTVQALLDGGANPRLKGESEDDLSDAVMMEAIDKTDPRYVAAMLRSEARWMVSSTWMRGVRALAERGEVDLLRVALGQRSLWTPWAHRALRDMADGLPPTHAEAARVLRGHEQWAQRRAMVMQRRRVRNGGAVPWGAVRERKRPRPPSTLVDDAPPPAATRPATSPWPAAAASSVPPPAGAAGPVPPPASAAGPGPGLTASAVGAGFPAPAPAGDAGFMSSMPTDQFLALDSDSDGGFGEDSDGGFGDF